MSRYCSGCAEKLERETFVNKLHVDGWGGSDWVNVVYFYCDNDECPQVGLMRRLALTEKPDLTVAALLMEDKIMGAELPNQISIDSDVMAQVNILTYTVNELIQYLEEQRLAAPPIENSNPKSDLRTEYTESAGKKMGQALGVENSKEPK